MHPRWRAPSPSVGDGATEPPRQPLRRGERHDRPGVLACAGIAAFSTLSGGSPLHSCSWPASAQAAHVAEPLTAPTVPGLIPPPSKTGAGDGVLPPEPGSVLPPLSSPAPALPAPPLPRVPPSETGDGAAGKPWAVKRAQEHVRRGLALFDEGDLAGAHAELERAYAIAPSFKILYNLAQISLRRKDYVSAESELRAYLLEGKGSVSRARRKEVEATLDQASARIAIVDVHAEGAANKLAVDDTSELALPLSEPLRVNVGRHTIFVAWPSGERQTKAIETAGGDHVVLRFDPLLPELKDNPRRSRLRLASAPAPEERTHGATFRLTERLADAGPTETHAKRTWPVWAAWTATALGAVGTAVTGVAALRTSHGLADERAEFPANPRTLNADASDTHRYAVAADVLGASTALLAGLALYLTLRD